jgi:hypothetical protein
MLLAGYIEFMNKGYSKLTIFFGVAVCLVLLGLAFRTYRQNQIRRKEILTNPPWNEPTPTEPVDPTDAWQFYENKQIGFSIRYPHPWNLSIKEVNGAPIVELTRFIDQKLWDDKIIIWIKEGVDNVYQKQQKSQTIEVGDFEFDIYLFQDGDCEEGDCTGAFIAAVTQKGDNDKFVFEVQNRLEIEKDYEGILATLKFFE